jgi:hypothetical protein
MTFYLWKPIATPEGISHNSAFAIGFIHLGKFWRDS